jgi:hypothetical protein
MAHLDRLAAGLALCFATGSLGLTGCGSSDGNKMATVGQPTLGTGAPMISPGGVFPGATAPTVGATMPTMTMKPALGTGGSPAAMMGGAGGAMMMAGNSGAGGAAMMMPPTTSTWTPMSNLDAMGNLMAPAPGEGFQIASTTFDLAPGQEVFNCFHAEVPTDVDFGVGEWDAQMSPGSHHFILYRAAGDTTPSGTLVNQGCTSGFGGSTWLYTQGTPRSHLQFPDGVAMVLSPHERIIFDMHYINTGTTTLHARIVLNINKVKAATYMKADAQVSFNLGIAIPPNGMQTVGGDCTPVPGANYFIMQTHTHKRGILSNVTRTLANGQPGEELVRTTNWDDPQAHIWQAAPFLTFQPGELFHYSCTYQNDRATTVTVGTSADANEMCMAEAYFFPAVANVPACN